MAGLKEIKRRIKSVQNTKKITYAMKLVSAAKLRKAQDWLMRARDFTHELDELLRDIVNEQDRALAHPLMERRETVRRVRVIVIGGRRGLCGAYNSNLNRAAEALLLKNAGSIETEFVLLGKKPAEYFRRRKYPYLQTLEDLSDNANEWPLGELYRDCEAAFLNGTVDEVWIMFTRFRSALSVQVQTERFLPFEADFSGVSSGAKGVTKYEPSPEAIFAALLPKYAHSKLLLACLESKTSEQGSRMTAMDAATENAGDLMDRLTLTHNKLRQAGITADILDIIGGSENLEK